MFFYINCPLTPESNSLCRPDLQPSPPTSNHFKFELFTICHVWKCAFYTAIFTPASIRQRLKKLSADNSIRRGFAVLERERRGIWRRDCRMDVGSVGVRGKSGRGMSGGRARSTMIIFRWGRSEGVRGRRWM